MTKFVRSFSLHSIYQILDARKSKKIYECTLKTANSAIRQLTDGQRLIRVDSFIFWG